MKSISATPIADEMIKKKQGILTSWLIEIKETIFQQKEYSYSMKPALINYDWAITWKNRGDLPYRWIASSPPYSICNFLNIFITICDYEDILYIYQNLESGRSESPPSNLCLVIWVSLSVTQKITIRTIRHC